MKRPIHFLPTALTDPIHPVRIHVIGAGGTGSHLVTHLADVNAGLLAFGHPGLSVTLFDPDVVADHNLVRQRFLPQEVGHFKVTAIIARTNRGFGLNWKAVPECYTAQTLTNYDCLPGQIVISCVDTAQARLQIDELLTAQQQRYAPDGMNRPYYWIDTGNGTHSGQVLVGTLGNIVQPPIKERPVVPSLPKITDEYRHMMIDEPQQPTCSAVQSLLRQDPFVNKEVAMCAAQLLWNCLRDKYTAVRGVFLDCRRHEKRAVLITLPKHTTHDTTLTRAAA